MESLKQPLVSVIVPCYNHAQYLPDALQSVLQQTYSNWECIVVNDASTDDTSEVAAEWVQKDARFKLVVAEKNSGLAASRNLGIEHSHGEFILPLDADDMISEEFIQVCIEWFMKKSNLRLVYSNVKCFGNSTEVVQRPAFSLSKLCFNNLIHCTAMYKRSDYKKTEGYRTNMRFGYEDWDFWMQLISKNDDVKQIARPLFFIRVRSDSMYNALTMDETKERMMRKQIRENNPRFYELCLPQKKRLRTLITSAFKKVTGK